MWSPSQTTKRFAHPCVLIPINYRLIISVYRIVQWDVIQASFFDILESEVVVFHNSNMQHQYGTHRQSKTRISWKWFNDELCGTSSMTTPDSHVTPMLQQLGWRSLVQRRASIQMSAWPGCYWPQQGPYPLDTGNTWGPFSPTSSWSIKVSIAAQKFATSCISDWKGSDTTSCISDCKGSDTCNRVNLRGIWTLDPRVTNQTT